MAIITIKTIFSGKCHSSESVCEAATYNMALQMGE